MKPSGINGKRKKTNPPECLKRSLPEHCHSALPAKNLCPAKQVHGSPRSFGNPVLSLPKGQDDRSSRKVPLLLTNVFSPSSPTVVIGDPSLRISISAGSFQAGKSSSANISWNKGDGGRQRGMGKGGELLHFRLLPKSMRQAVLRKDQIENYAPKAERTGMGQYGLSGPLAMG